MPAQWTGQLRPAARASLWPDPAIDPARAGNLAADACDASLCSQAPLFASAEAAQGWLGTHPGGRVFPIREAWDLSAYRSYQDCMSALLDLTN